MNLEGKQRQLRMYDDKVIFEDSKQDQCLVMSRNSADGSTDIRMEGEDDLGGTAENDCAQLIPIDGIFGVYELLSGPFVALIVDSELTFQNEPDRYGAGSIEFRRVTKMAVIPLFTTGKLLSEDKQADEDRYLHLLHKTLSSHQWYFSYTHDVTHTLQRFFKLSDEQRRQPLWRRADRRFFWNFTAVTGITACRGADDWVLPVMAAYVDARPECLIAEHSFTLLFVSRRSCFRQGCRFSKRGIDADGNVANFVETEQSLLFKDGQITAHVQIRGSIPVIWNSPVTMKYEPKVHIIRDPIQTFNAFQKHIDQLLSIYGNRGIIIANLIDKKRDQKSLGTAFEEVASSFKQKLDKPLMYVWFDFHAECRKMKWHNLSKLVDIVDSAFKAQGYFCRSPTGQILLLQNGVLRTNCMDNLDRTNVVQSIFARRTLITQLGQESHPGGTVLESPFKTFEHTFKDVWGNNADAISYLYAGTGALKTDFTRTGKRTKRGALMDGWNSVMRYYLNNFVDGTRQDGLDILLGRYKPELKQRSPCFLRPDQETFSSFITKVFVLMIAIFSTLNLVGCTGSTLAMNLFWAMIISTAVVMGTFFKIVKKGGKLGNKLVVLPTLCPEQDYADPKFKSA